MEVISDCELTNFRLRNYHTLLTPILRVLGLNVAKGT